MKTWISIFILLFVTLFAGTARADICENGGTCVAKQDLTVMLDALKEKKCLLSTTPTVKADAITIVVDRQGRIYTSGSDPHPFKLQLQWCNYDVAAVGQTSVVAAQYVEPQYGFRFRPKAMMGLLGTELLSGVKLQNAVDGGVLIEPFYYHFLNINGYVGVRSVGAGLGIDITKNFGTYVGYSITWGTWRSNPMVGLSFAFW